MMMRCFISFMLYNYCPTLRSPFEIKSISPHIKEKAKNQSPGIIFEQPFYARVAHTSCITAIVGKWPRGLLGSATSQEKSRNLFTRSLKGPSLTPLKSSAW